MSEARLPKYDDQFAAYQEKVRQAVTLKESAAHTVANKLITNPAEGIRVLRMALEQAQTKFVKGESAVDQVLTGGVLAATNYMKASKRMPNVSQLSQENYLYALIYALRSTGGATKHTSFKSLVFYFLYDACLEGSQAKRSFKELYQYDVIDIEAITTQLIKILENKKLIEVGIEEKLADQIVELIYAPEGFQAVKKALDEGGKAYEAVGYLSFIKSWGRKPDTGSMTKEDYIIVLQALLTDSGKVNNTSLKGLVLKQLIDAFQFDDNEKQAIDDLFKCGLLHLKTIIDQVCKVIDTARLIERNEKKEKDDAKAGTEMKQI